MKKNYLLIIVLIAANSLFAQAPAGYYNSATGTGFTLKTQLKRIIDNNNDGLTPEYQSVQLTYNDLYTTFPMSDVDIYYDHTNPNLGIILDMYSEIPSGPDNYEYVYGSSQQDNGSGGTFEGDKFNREHTIPQSVFNQSLPMRSDAHFVIPSDKYVNGVRGNTPYGETNTPTYTSSNGTKLGNNRNADYASGYTNTVFEPIDEFKGDIARMYFYFVTRYEDQLTSFNAYDMFDGSANQGIAQPFLDILYNWHLQDPVSQRELDRNNAIFSQHNNRNPFIDNPSYVQIIWQSVLSNKSFSLSDNDISIYPNPLTNQVLTIKTPKNLNVSIFNVLGQNVFESKVTSKSNKLNLSKLKQGVYIVKLESSSGSISKKLIIK
jgi:endonuclease I